jgi:GINS complex subunit 3
MWRVLDLDAVLSQEERIPCIFQYDAQGLGFLDPMNERTNLSQGAKVELPLYMAKELAKRSIVEMELPKHFDRRMRDNIAASALNINLKEFSPYFFEVGMDIAEQLRDRDLQDTVRIAFTGDRYRSLMMNALSG